MSETARRIQELADAVDEIEKLLSKAGAMTLAEIEAKLGKPQVNVKLAMDILVAAGLAEPAPGSGQQAPRYRSAAGWKDPKK